MATLVAAVAQHRDQHFNRESSNLSKGMSCRGSFRSLKPNKFNRPPSRKRPPPSFIPKDPTFIEGFTCAELWAGPAYTNSPPPNSLPIPQFSLRQKRTFSLELPAVDPRVLISPADKSAPVSPNSDLYSSPSDFFLSAASATENLKRILNLKAL